MGIFDRLRKPGATTKETKPSKKEPKADEKPAVTEEQIKVAAVPGGRSSYMLVSPRISEKAASMATGGTYVFNVPIVANKVEIRKAVEALYKVNVTQVRTVRGIGKITRRGRVAGQRVNWKKALVTLKSGQKIDLYEGV